MPEDVFLPYIMTTHGTADLYLDHEQISQPDSHHCACFY